MSVRAITCLALAVALPGVAAAPAAAQHGAPGGEWPTYGGDLGHTRYAALDRIDAGNFGDLELAWRFRTENLGPGPEYVFQSTPLMVGGVLYTTAGTRRAAVALDAATGELLWVHRLNEGARGAAAPRRLSGRGLTYWDDGGDGVIFYVTPGYRLVALNARTGRRAANFGENGLVDLKQGLDQELDPVTGEIGLHAAPVIADGVVVIGAAHLAGVAPATKEKPTGHVRGYDARTGERKWIFHTIPGADEFGNDTWLADSWRYTGNTGVWGQMTIDPELGYVYLPVETPPATSTGGTGPATTCSRTASWPSTFRPASARGTSRRFTTTCGTSTSPTPPSSSTSPSTGATSRPSRSRASRRSSTCSTAPPASRCGPSRSGRCRSRTCPAR